MRRLLVLLAAGALLVTAGDGREAPSPKPVFSGGACFVPRPNSYPGLDAAVQFWYRRTGAERAALSGPAEARVHAAYRKAVRRAGRHGLKVQPPRLRQTKPELVLLLGPGIRYLFSMHYPGPRIILVNGWWVERLADWELEYLMAHELGHAIDVQNERRGHRFLDARLDTDDDDFVADILSMFLTEPGAYSRFVEKHEGLRSMGER